MDMITTERENIKRNSVLPVNISMTSKIRLDDIFIHHFCDEISTTAALEPPLLRKLWPMWGVILWKHFAMVSKKLELEAFHSPITGILKKSCLKIIGIFLLKLYSPSLTLHLISEMALVIFHFWNFSSSISFWRYQDKNMKLAATF